MTVDNGVNKMTTKAKVTYAMGEKNGDMRIVLQLSIPKEYGMMIMEDANDAFEIELQEVVDILEDVDGVFDGPTVVNNCVNCRSEVDMDRIIELKDELEIYDMSVAIPKKEMKKLYKKYADILDLEMTKEYNEDSECEEWFIFKDGTFLKPDEDIAQYVMGWDE